MCTKIPEPTSCLCIPLRVSIFVYVYLKLIIIILMISTMWVMWEQFLLIVSAHWDTLYFINVCCLLLPLVLEVVLSVYFLVNAHQNNHNHMKTFQRYAIRLVILEVLLWLVDLGVDGFTADIGYARFESKILHIAVSLFILTALTGLQIYFIILVRSETWKLEKASKTELVDLENAECPSQNLV